VYKEQIWRQWWPFLLLWLNIVTLFSLTILNHALDYTTFFFSCMKTIMIQLLTSSCTIKLLCFIYFLSQWNNYIFSFDYITHVVGSNFQLEVNHVENLDHWSFYLRDQITFSLLLTIYNKFCYMCQSCPNSIYIPCVCCYVHLFILLNLHYYNLSKNGS